MAADEMAGVYYGIVTDNKDPEKLGRVRVKMEHLGENSETGWIPVINLYATRKAGAFFLPETGDQVVVGFMGSSTDQPVVFGSIWSQERRPPRTEENTAADLNADGKNNLRFIKSKGGNQIIMDDTEGGEKMHFILAGGKTRITFSASDKSLTINGDIINIDAKMLMLILSKKLNMKFSNKATVNSKLMLHISKDKANIKSGGEITVKGATVLLN